MKTIFAALLFVLLITGSSAQDLFLTGENLLHDSVTRNRAVLSSEYFFASNALTNQIAVEVLKNGFVTDEMKDVISKKLEGKNRLGGGLKTQLYYMHRIDSVNDKHSALLYIGLADENQIDSRFNDDVFELYFRGNKNYAGKTADVGNFQFNIFHYQQLNIGVMEKYESKKFSYTYGIGVSLNKGQNMFRVTAPEGTVYTQSEGEYLDVALQISLAKSDSMKTKFIDVSGIGASGNAFFSIANKKGNAIRITAHNVGNIIWNNHSTVVDEDSAFRFDGIEVKDLLHFNDTIKTTSTIDSIYVQPFLKHRKSQSVTIPLPALIGVDFILPIKNTKLTIDAGGNILLNANYDPQYFVTGIYSFNYKNILSTRISYGGYTKFNVGLGYSFATNSGWVINASSDYISSLIDFNKGNAQGAFVSLEKRF